jgi:hypothetical protein
LKTFKLTYFKEDNTVEIVKLTSLTLKKENYF